jgi:hypothetical protein
MTTFLIHNGSAPVAAPVVRPVSGLISIRIAIIAIDSEVRPA